MHVSATPGDRRTSKRATSQASPVPSHERDQVGIGELNHDRGHHEQPGCRRGACPTHDNRQEECDEAAEELVVHGPEHGIVHVRFAEKREQRALGQRAQQRWGETLLRMGTAERAEPGRLAQLCGLSVPIEPEAEQQPGKQHGEHHQADQTQPALGGGAHHDVGMA